MGKDTQHVVSIQFTGEIRMDRAQRFIKNKDFHVATVTSIPTSVVVPDDADNMLFWVDTTSASVNLTGLTDLGLPVDGVARFRKLSNDAGTVYFNEPIQPSGTKLWEIATEYEVGGEQLDLRWTGTQWWVD